MKRKLFFALLAITTLSCNVRNAEGSLATEDGYKYYLQSSPQFRIRLYNDYYFHSLKKKYFPEISNSFLKYAVAKTNSLRPELMYVAHTIVQPYYSSVGVIYKNAHVDPSFVNAIKTDLKRRLKTSFSRPDSVETNYGTATRLGYQVLNPTTKIRSTNWEYLVNYNGTILRFFFWTSNSDTSIISHEVQTIVGTIQQQ